MKRKQRFLKAVQILAPGDAFILNAARRVAEDGLPVFPGGAALELVVALHKLASPTSQGSCTGSQETSERENCEGQDPHRLSMSHALRIQSAHYWLKLGETGQALLELGGLSSEACNHPLAIKARLAVIRAAREMNEVTVQE